MTKKNPKIKEDPNTEIKISEIEGHIILEEGKELYTVMLESKQEVDLMLQEMAKQRNVLNQMMENVKTRLEVAVTGQEKANLVLRKIPESLERKIEEIVPKVAKELDKVYEEKVEKYSELTLECINKLDDLRQATSSFESGRKRRSFFNLIATSILTVSIAAGSAYLVLKYYPNQVHFNSATDVVIERSDVVFFGTKKVLNNNKN
jgi:hypothetical protein